MLYQAGGFAEILAVTYFSTVWVPNILFCPMPYYWTHPRNCYLFQQFPLSELCYSRDDCLIFEFSRIFLNLIYVNDAGHFLCHGELF